MESTTSRGRDEQSATTPAPEFAEQLAKASAKPAAKPKPAVKRKPAAKKPRRARAKSQAAQQEETVSQMVGVGELGELVGDARQPVPLELAGIGLELADIVTGERRRGEENYGDTSSEAVESQGLTLEEVSQLLVSRERRGFARGHEQGYQSARQAAMVRLQRERSEAVAGALMMVARQLEGVLHDLARPDEAAKQEAARHLAVLTAEFAKASDRFANGEEFSS